MRTHRGNRRLFLLIQRFVNRYGPWRFHASQAWMARRLGVSVRSIKRWIHELREDGAIECKRRSQDTMLYNIERDILAPQMAPQMAPRILTNSSTKSMNTTCRKEAKPPARQEGFADELRRGLEDGGVGYGEEAFMGRVVELAIIESVEGRVAGAIFAALVRQERFRHASEAYVLAAFAGELQRYVKRLTYARLIAKVSA